MGAAVRLAEYLFTRLRQLGVESIHGVPGDYNLELLDYVEPDIHWVGNCNELNAGYAADAYARIKGLGALITTFGVGELSAVNAIAGAYAELAPVVHIVGTPARHLQDSRALIHHTLNDGDYRLFAKMHAHVTVAQASLRDPRECPELIDWTLQQCLKHGRPVYIEFPIDMVSIPVAADRLESSLKVWASPPLSDASAALELVLSRIYSCRYPAIVVDGESRAFNILNEVDRVVQTTRWPTYTSVFGKGLVDEPQPSFRGIWKGSAANKTDQDYMKSCDLVLCFGPHFSSINTYNYTAIPQKESSILFKADSIQAGDQTFRDISPKHFLSSLLEKLDPSKLASRSNAVPSLSSSLPNGYDKKRNPQDVITQAQFYHEFSSFLRSGDIILAETGTAGIGCREFHLPPNTHLFKPTTWLSIGYMLPAAQGAFLAQRELHMAKKWPVTTTSPPSQPENKSPPRTILLIGDGSFQMTVQELSTIIREKLNVILILINNDGYTIERCIHGQNKKYNDIAKWNYLRCLELFGVKPRHHHRDHHEETKDYNNDEEKEGETEEEEEYPCHTYTAKTWRDLDDILDVMSAKGSSSNNEKKKMCLQMVEVFMGRDDAPEYLLRMLDAQKQKAREKEEEEEEEEEEQTMKR